MPRNADGTVRLHLGCGAIDAPGYINIDLRPTSNVHFVHDVAPLEMFADGSVNLIYASHVLAHLLVAEAKDAIGEWHRVLKRGGVLRVAVPDFAVMARMYMERVPFETILGPLMGDQGYEQNRHKSAFDEQYLRRLMEEAGFRGVERWDPATVSWHDFEDTSSKRYEINGRQYRISLNLQGVKE